MTETNALTNSVINYLLANGHFASRIQSQGQYSPTRGRWIKSKVRRGIGDIIACVDGKFWMIEIKTGADKQSLYQKTVEKDVTKAKGIYLIVRTFGQFLGFYESNNSNSDPSQSGDNVQPNRRSFKKSGLNTNRSGSKRQRRKKSL